MFSNCVICALWVINSISSCQTQKTFNVKNKETDVLSTQPTLSPGKIYGDLAILECVSRVFFAIELKYVATPSL